MWVILIWNNVCNKSCMGEKTLNKYKKKGFEEIEAMFDLRRLVV
jgi:hypothetical protein